MATNIDSKGVSRGNCTLCDCIEYEKSSTGGNECGYCNHFPPSHINVNISNSGYSSPPSSPTCKVTGCNKSVFIESDGTVHDFCGKTHAKAYHSSSHTQSPSSQSQSQSQSQSSQTITCKLPGCTRAPFIENGKSFDFCGKTHASQFKKLGIASPAKKIPSHVTTVKLLQSSDKTYQEIEHQFTSKWLHNSKKGTVVSVLKVYPNQTLIDQHDAYLQTIIAKGVKSFGKGGPGNVHRRFHGTENMKCTLGLNNNQTLCTNTSCNVCCILTTGLKVSFKKKWGRFGQGIYLTSTSSKSNDYNTGTSSALGSNYRSMFIFKVVVGKGHMLKSDNSALTSPPTGYDSVLGETGSSLNYDELIVYNDAAVLPAFVITYSL